MALPYLDRQNYHCCSLIPTNISPPLRTLQAEMEASFCVCVILTDLDRLTAIQHIHHIRFLVNIMIISFVLHPRSINILGFIFLLLALSNDNLFDKMKIIFQVRLKNICAISIMRRTKHIGTTNIGWNKTFFRFCCCSHVIFCLI